jgi:hypothetical protein
LVVRLLCYGSTLRSNPDICQKFKKKATLAKEWTTHSSPQNDIQKTFHINFLNCVNHNFRTISMEFPWILSFQKKNVTNSEKSVKICTDKKEKKIFLIYKEIQIGSVARAS